MIRPILLAATVLAPVPASAFSPDRFDPSPYIDVLACQAEDWTIDSACVDEQIADCDVRADASGVSTAGGRYACPHEAFDQIDARLNAIYLILVARARERDAIATAELEIMAERENMLRDAQRKWVAFRQSMCELNADWHRIGSGRDSVVAHCATRLTIAQISVLLREVPSKDSRY